MPKGDHSPNTPANQTGALRPAAEAFAASGWKIFPVSPIGSRGANDANGKKPYPGTRGFKDASDDLSKIEAWWKEKPDANIGLACEASGLVVLDVDLDLDVEEDAARWERFCSENYLPDTFVQRTPGGGLHLIYRAETGVRYPGALDDQDGRIADIKHKGYIVLAPSVASSSRREAPAAYQVVDDRDPMPAPGWLLQRQSKNGKGTEDKTDDFSDNLRAFVRQERDERLLNLLRETRNLLHKREDWLKLGFAIHAAYAGTRWAHDAYCAWIAFSERWEAPPGTKLADFAENAERVWSDAKAGRDGGVTPATAQMILGNLPKMPPSDVVPVRPKPEPDELHEEDGGRVQLTGLAGEIAKLVRHSSDRELKVFPEAAALMAMSALAAPTHVIKGPQGRTTVNLYALLLGGTGSGKEDCRKATRMVLRAAGRPDELLDGIASDKALHRALHDAGSSDTSNASFGAITMAIDEGGLHLSAIRQGNDAHQRLLLSLMMRLWGLGLDRLGPHKYADNRHEIGAVEGPRLTTLWTSTPKALQDATSQEDSESGQLNRFLVFAEQGLSRLKDGEIDRDAMRNPPEDVVGACRRFPPRLAIGRQLERVPDKVIEMTPAAARLQDAFRIGEVEDKRQLGGAEGESWARAAEYVLRVAGLLALSDAAMDPEQDALDEVVCEVHHVETAIQIIRQAVGGTAKIAKNAGKSEIEQLKDRVKAAISELAGPDGFANARNVKKKVLRGVHSPLRNGIVTSMIEDGEIFEVRNETGGRPSILWSLTETTDET
ncbi:bifunctional DNA primase/polymerase [Maritimibacter harenae]|uniref:bifunctional DNA primase/polymerase n=1 Tax=Maritimibacter harenae TaxID=2606218 RepID=UPI00136E436C|nr:bifunctional DNA primase/polymerase [Maritimibacter harenae]